MEELAAAARMIGHSLSPIRTLRSSERSRVIRAAVDGGNGTVIVKAHASGFSDCWARESAALGMLRGRGLPAPNLIAAID